MKVPYLRNIFLCSLLFSMAALIAGCKKSSTPAITVQVPTVTTTSVILNVTSTSAQSGGVILSAGNGTITKNGVCYSATNKTPTTADGKTSDSTVVATTVASFISQLINLTPKTTYYLRAYATNSAGTGYGSVIQFTTADNLSAVTATVTTFAGNGTAGYMDASGANAEFNNPQGISVDNNGNVYVSDSFNNLVRKITAGGDVSTLAGMQTLGYTDGPAASAQFYGPAGQAVDGQGNLYIADFGNNVIRKITPSGVVSTYAGTGQAGYVNGAATSASLTGTSDAVAEFSNPQAVTVDGSGNIYVADQGNNAIRKITPAGRVTTLAGRRSRGFIDGTGANAAFSNPSGVAVDSKGNVYVADGGNSSLRKITPAGVVTTLVGNPSQTSLLNYPSGLAIDTDGGIYIVDEGGRILKFTTENVLYNIAGSLNAAGFVDGTNAAARFNKPQGIAIDANHNIYVADQYNNSIRKIVITNGPI
jgi:sugar lactone lactonase YvrE